MPEILIISGKGGTGKTSITAAFAQLAERPLISDLDVDAPDLHLLLKPEASAPQAFMSGHTAVITDACQKCGICVDNCLFNAIIDDDPHPLVDPIKCEGCNVCVYLCPEKAILFPEKHCGNWYASETRFGPMVHAQLFPGEENSGRLVTLLKKEAKTRAENCGVDLILSDGPPGIGCPVISSLAGANLAVVVTEPTPSGVHDLERVIALCRHFRLRAGVVINKYDLNREQTQKIKGYCEHNRIQLLGRIANEPAVIEAMVRGQTIIEFKCNGTTDRIRRIWKAVTNSI